MATAAKKVVKKVRIDSPPSSRPTVNYEDGSKTKTVKGQKLAYHPVAERWYPIGKGPKIPLAGFPVRKNTKKAAR